jgi:hypothetical protein
MADNPMQPWMRAAIGVCGTDLLRDIVNDNRPAKVAAPSTNVTVVGSGKVQDFDVGPKYRPYVPPPTEEAPAERSERSGWQGQTELKPPPGVALVDELVFQQDVADLEARGRQEAAAMGISLRDWVKLQMRERQAQKEKAAKDRKETPK